ncbi:MAG: RNA methyltransferase [Bacteroidales bacterium]|jgi:TrmH family RNA methyltransferase|nr:RNA methyltransferase [Bacteroidales bacterium]
MLSKNQVKYIQSLRLGKFRDEYRVFIVEGVKMVDELLKSSFHIRQILGTTSWIETHKDILKAKNPEVQVITEAELQRISNLVTPNEVLAVAGYPENDLPAREGLGKIILVLDGIQDPGNLGTIIRTADWFGIRQVICSENTADIFNPKVVQATMGSIFRAGIYYTVLKDFLEGLGPDWKIYGADTEGENIFGLVPGFPLAIVIGNESKGISPGLYPALTHKIGIPSGSTGAESLNAAVAAGIIMAEFGRKI